MNQKMSKFSIYFDKNTFPTHKSIADILLQELVSSTKYKVCKQEIELLGIIFFFETPFRSLLLTIANTVLLIIPPRYNQLTKYRLIKIIVFKLFHIRNYFQV